MTEPHVPTVLSQGGSLPSYAHPGDAGADLCAAADVTLEPGMRALVGTGVSVALPLGHVGLITPRSGSAWRHGLSIVNTPGVLDAGYRGEIKVCLVNLDPHTPIAVRAGDRIAQLVVVPVVTAAFTPVDTLDETARGEGGYGSTGGLASLE